MDERNVAIDRELADGGPEVVRIHDAIHLLNLGENFTHEQMLERVDPHNPESVLRIAPETGAFCRIIRKDARRVLWVHWLFPQGGSVQLLAPVLVSALELATSRWPETRQWGAEAIWPYGKDAHDVPDEGEGASVTWADFIETAGIGRPDITRWHPPNDPKRERHYFLIRWPVMRGIRALRIILRRLDV